MIDRDQMMKDQADLMKLLLCSTSERFELLLSSNLHPNQVYMMNLEGAPHMVAMMVTQHVSKYSEQQYVEFMKFIRSQPVPSFAK